MGMNNSICKGRSLKMAVISLGKITQLVATELKRITRCHLVCSPGKGNSSGTRQMQMTMLKYQMAERNM